TFLVPADDAAEQQMQATFRQLAGDEGATQAIQLHGREVQPLRSAAGVIWFDFATLCGGFRSQNDYLELAQDYHTLFLSAVPCMSRDQASEARRFTWLVDVLYDHRVNLIISAACPAEALYTEGPQASEFVRTVSRLVEMRTHEYLATAHRLQVADGTDQDM